MTSVFTFTPNELEYITGLLAVFNREVEIETFALYAKLIDPNGEIVGHLSYDPTVGGHTFVVQP